MSKVIGSWVFEGEFYNPWTWNRWRKKGTYNMISSGGITTWGYHASAKAQYEKTGEPRWGVSCECGYAEPFGMYCMDGVSSSCPRCGEKRDYAGDEKWICTWNECKVIYDHSSDKWVAAGESDDLRNRSQRLQD